MTSPLSQFENVRILWCAPGVRTSGRDGFSVAPGDAYLIRAFLKRRATPEMLSERLAVPAVNGSELEFKGYCVRYAVLPQSQVPNFATVNLSTLTWDETALLPPGIGRDSKVKMHMPGHKTIDARFSDKDGSYGQEGIGAIVRGILGDPIYLIGGTIG
jgi:hypothetical protein